MRKEDLLLLCTYHFPSVSFWKRGRSRASEDFLRHFFGCYSPNAQIYGKPINRLSRWNLFQWSKAALWEDPPGCKHDHDGVLAWGAEQSVQVGHTLAHPRARSRSRELSQQASGKQSVRIHRLQRWGEPGGMGGKLFLLCAMGWWQNRHLPTQPSVSRA